MISDFSLFPLLGSIAIALFAFFMLVYRPKNITNLLFLMFCFTVAIWLFGTYKMFKVNTDESVVFWDKIVYIGVTLMPAFLFHFGVVYLGRGMSRFQTAAVSIGYLLSMLFLAVSQTSSGFFDGVFRYRWGAHTIAGPLHSLFLVFFFIYIYGFLAQLIRFCRRSRGVMKSQLCYILGGFAFLLLVGPFAYLPAYRVPTPPIVFVAVIPFVALLFHAMFRYEFLSEFDELAMGTATTEMR